MVKKFAMDATLLDKAVKVRGGHEDCPTKVQRLAADDYGEC